MDFTPDNPFRVVDKILKDVGTIPVLIDFHAEATSEKLAVAYYLDGKVSALWARIRTSRRRTNRSYRTASAIRPTSA